LKAVVATQLPVNGFLGTGATFGADLNLIVQLAMGSALIIGVILAKKKRYRAHGACQTTVLLLNVWMIGFEMWPSFRLQVMPHFPRVLHTAYYTIATVHAALGIAAELLGIYIVLVAGTELIPPSLRFTEWKRWMRIELALWLLALSWGLGTYYEWYVVPFR
jgi:uncharacterized membrane protein YozB (DUF420 family)